MQNNKNEDFDTYIDKENRNILIENYEDVMASCISRIFQNTENNNSILMSCLKYKIEYSRFKKNDNSCLTRSTICIVTFDDLQSATHLQNILCKTFDVTIFDSNCLVSDGFETNIVKQIAQKHYHAIFVDSPNPKVLLIAFLYKAIWGATLFLNVKHSVCTNSKNYLAQYTIENTNFDIEFRNALLKHTLDPAMYFNALYDTDAKESYSYQGGRHYVLASNNNKEIEIWLSKNMRDPTRKIYTFLYSFKALSLLASIFYKQDFFPHSERVYSIEEKDLLHLIADYQKNKPKRKAKIAVCTAIFGNYDPLIIPESINFSWDYIVFSDQITLGKHIFDQRPLLGEFTNNTLKARYVKTHVHILLKEYDYVIWIDSNLLITGNFLNEYMEYFQNSDLQVGLHRHPDRSTIKEEAAMCARLKKSDPDAIYSQISYYYEHDFKDNLGLPETNLLIRKNLDSAVAAFNCLWWQEISTRTFRDQLSVMFVIWKTNLKFEFMWEEANFRNHSRSTIRLFPHGGLSNNTLPAYNSPLFMKFAENAPPLFTDDQNSQKQYDSLLTYKAQRATSVSKKAKVAIYTVITDNYDVLKIPLVCYEGFDYICFTDRLDFKNSGPWQIRHITYFGADTTRTARFYKINPHIVLSEYQYSIWIDAHILINDTSLANMFKDFDKNKKIFSTIPHPFRDCAYVEADICANEMKDVKKKINAQVNRYKKSNFPSKFGLYETQILIRRHTAQVQKLCQAWWDEVETYSKRDQISLPYVVWKQNFPITLLTPKGISTRNHSGFSFFQHGLKSTARDKRYNIPNFLDPSHCLDTTPYWMACGGNISSTAKMSYAGYTVDIVICVHNSLEDVKNCLKSIEGTLLEKHTVIIVNDGSNADTTQFLLNFIEGKNQFRYVYNYGAIGYTKSANIGMRLSSADYIILLNSDTIVSEGWVLKLLETAESNPRIGIVGPLSNAASWQSVPLVHDPKDSCLMVNAIPSGHNLESINALCEKVSIRDIFPCGNLVNGFCYCIKRKVIDTIGYFDEINFPIGYGEEDDFSLRATKAGFLCAFATNCYVFHAKSKSFGSARRNALAAQGRHALCAKHSNSKIKNAILAIQNNELLSSVRERFCDEIGVEPEKRAKHLLSIPATNIEINMPPSPTITEDASSLDQNVFPHELAFTNISYDEYIQNMEFVAQMYERSSGIPKTALWILPAFRNPLAGGIRTILTAAHEFTKRWGTKNIFVLQETSTNINRTHSDLIRSVFSNWDFDVLYCNEHSDVKKLPESCVSFCTSWPTAFILAKYNHCKFKFYFMQDYETLFYPSGTMSALIDETYNFGFYCIANSKGIYEKYKLFSDKCSYFNPGINTKIFYPDKNKNNSGKLRIFFYGRPNNQRNAFALGVQALTQVKKYFGENVEILSAGAKWKPQNHGVAGVINNLGILTSMVEVAQLYRTCHAGLIFMLTPHPSYQPFEFMASGCATVTNRNKGTSWLFKDKYNAVVTSMLPSDIAHSTISLLTNKNVMETIQQGGLETVCNYTWKNALDTICNYVSNPHGISNDF